LLYDGPKFEPSVFEKLMSEAETPRGAEIVAPVRMRSVCLSKTILVSAIIYFIFD